MQQHKTIGYDSDVAKRSLMFFNMKLRCQMLFVHSMKTFYKSWTWSYKETSSNYNIMQH